MVFMKFRVRVTNNYNYTGPTHICESRTKINAKDFRR